MTDFQYEAHFSVPARIGAVPHPTDPSRGSVPVRPHASNGGEPLATVFMMLADTVVGMRLEQYIDDSWTFTTDFSLRRSLGCPTSGEITCRADILRHGSRLLVESLDFEIEGRSIGHAQITFMRTPLRDGEAKIDISAIRERMAGMVRPELEEPLADASRLTVTDAAAGTVVMEPADELRRPGGFVQGAMVTLLGEWAALAMAEAHVGGPCVVTDLDVRYLIGARTGPIVTTARFLGDPADGRIAVEARDQGHDDVITTTYLAAVVPAPS